MAGLYVNHEVIASRELKIGILTVSDRCSAGTQEDKSGPNLKALVQTSLHRLGVVKVITGCVPDELLIIKSCLLHWADTEKCILILTTGGTGFTSRDVTPEATKAVIEREAPGLVVRMLSKSIETTPMAMLSRPVCGIRNSTIIVNLPGSKKGSQECFEFILPALGHAFDLVSSDEENVASTHSSMEQTKLLADQLPVTATSPCSHRHSHRESMDSLQSYGSSSVSSDQGYDFSCSSSESSMHQCPHQRAVYIDTPKVAERDRFSPYPMILVSKALSIVLSTVKVQKKRHLVNLHAGLLGKVLMEDVRAKEPYPPFAASVKDGYAVIAADGAGVRRVVEPITAGQVPSQSLRSGQCSRITTGAPIPVGADAVVQVEDTELVEAADNGNVEVLVRMKTPPSILQDIRPVGFDIKQGETILSAGEKLGPSELGLMAMAGVNMVSVYTPPSIGLFSTGDELVSPGAEKSEGQIYDSNKIALLTAIREQGFNAADLGTLPDNFSLLRDKISNVIDDANHQILITTGGVSMGEKDLVKKFLAQFGDIKFGRVQMKPGKPTTFATITRGPKTIYFFALPGNPVSALVTFYLFALPAIRKLAGFKKPYLQRIQARLDFDICLDPRPEYHRARLNWDTDDGVPLASSTGSQCSSRLLSMRSCHALLELPSCETIRKMTRGSLVTGLLLPKLIT
ncbi:gephyrin-like isoform X2 [Hydractinia symbiolongicarpus]|uniref:gephyrin-like isoform X2 n=1 Tax=Hydractinia symbiolongicarpus TaxID=13093 RepID=UPI00254E300A|nr:gephyrin-like isoform X2 [Hydractinia symbiolongicarpus]